MIKRYDFTAGGGCFGLMDTKRSRVWSQAIVASLASNPEFAKYIVGLQKKVALLYRTKECIYSWHKKIYEWHFNMIYKLEPTELVCKLMQRSYLNDRVLGKLHFFDCSQTNFGRSCLCNTANDISSRWDFDWFFMMPKSFKTNLSKQLDERRQI